MDSITYELCPGNRLLIGVKMEWKNFGVKWSESLPVRFMNPRFCSVWLSFQARTQTSLPSPACQVLSQTNFDAPPP
jgi:hypothetical protein